MKYAIILVAAGCLLTLAPGSGCSGWQKPTEADKPGYTAAGATVGGAIGGPAGAVAGAGFGEALWYILTGVGAAGTAAATLKKPATTTPPTT